MSEVNTVELKIAVESQHGGIATYVQSVPVHEEHEGQTVWDGMVAVFDLAGHPKATRAYAWSYERPDGTRRFFAVLHMPPVKSPRDAVRAAIVAEAKTPEGWITDKRDDQTPIQHGRPALSKTKRKGNERLGRRTSRPSGRK